MKFEEMLLKRESCRSYKDTPVERDLLVKICEAGRLSPSACNSQPWKFIIVDEPATKANLIDALTVEGGATGAPWENQCPAFIVIAEQNAKVMPAVIDYYKDSQRFAQGDIGIAMMNMCYQAMDLGLSTCMIGICDQKKMEKYLNIPEGSTVRIVIAVGYGNETNQPRPKMRKKSEDVISFNQF